MLNLNILTLISSKLTSFEDQYAFRCTSKDFCTAITENIRRCYIDFHIKDTLETYPKKAEMRMLNVITYDKGAHLNLLFKDAYYWRNTLQEIHIETPFVRLFPKILNGFKRLAALSLFIRNRNLGDIVCYLPSSLETLSLLYDRSIDWTSNREREVMLYNLKNLSISTLNNKINLSDIMPLFQSARNSLVNLYVDAMMIVGIGTLVEFWQLKKVTFVNLCSTAFKELAFEIEKMKCLESFTVMFMDSMHVNENISILINSGIAHVQIINNKAFDIVIRNDNPIRTLHITHLSVHIGTFSNMRYDSNSLLLVDNLYIDMQNIYVMKDLNINMQVDVMEIYDGELTYSNVGDVISMLYSGLLKVNRLVLKDYQYSIERTLTLFNFPQWYV